MIKNIALLQMDVTIGDPDKNFSHAKELMLTALQSKNGKPDILILPETFNTGFAPSKDLLAIADKDGMQTKSLCSELARQYEVNIVAGSVTTLKNNKLYNTLYVFDRRGHVVCEYDKVHLFSLGNEHEFFTAGDHIGFFTLDGIKCGAMICYDLRFPELARSLRLKGAEIIFVVAEWPAIRHYPWIILNKARAIENQCYICAVNGVGYLQPDRPDSGRNGGSSMLINPMGELITECPQEQENIQIGVISMDAVQKARTTMLNEQDRQPHVYKLD